MRNTDDFHTLGRVAARPDALNPEAWYPEVGAGKLNFVLERKDNAMNNPAYNGPLGVFEGMYEPEIEPHQCYLCRITTDFFPDDYLRSAGLPQSDLKVCGQCEGSYRHQQDLKEAWLAEESAV